MKNGAWKGMRAQRVALMLLLGSCLGGAPLLRAQSTPFVHPELQADTRVRLLAPVVSARPILGRVLHATGDTVVIQSRTTLPTAVALGEIDWIERSLGRSHGWGLVRGLGYGTLVGGAAVASMVVAGADLCIYISCLRRDLAGAAGGFFIGAALGAPVGAVLGVVTGVEKWQRLRLPR